MRKPYCINEDVKKRTLQDCVEILALSIADNVINQNERIEAIQQQCKILNSLTNALVVIKS